MASSSHSSHTPDVLWPSSRFASQLRPMSNTLRVLFRSPARKWEEGVGGCGGGGTALEMVATTMVEVVTGEFGIKED
ncbi:hypothetical protein MA16_Dca020332 [Dendrobium catenatum]|uniref:Uncharacterized protein n=1 Tax=Dendrobium catenatum TaxID=906689 RepID=A0A2I0VVK9_9ASPA|nr:hypothetical protein MA16_Dca020332 [Dendrobium catenatum]